MWTSTIFRSFFINYRGVIKNILTKYSENVKMNLELGRESNGKNKEFLIQGSHSID